MWKCPVCEKENIGTFCAFCGFDRSRDYEHFPTLQMLKSNPVAISRLRAGQENPAAAADAPELPPKQENAGCHGQKKQKSRDWFTAAAAVVAVALVAILAIIGLSPGGSCGDNLRWSLSDTGLLTISGKGSMTDYSSTDSPWYSYCSDIRTVVVEDGVTGIGDFAFYDCTSLTGVTIPDSVTRIGISAFDTCSSLTSITIPDSVTSIGDSAFRDCTSLESMTLPFVGGSATKNTFLGYIFGASSSDDNIDYVPESLKAVILTDSCISIGDSAFDGCTSLTSIIIPDSVTNIDYSAFSYCTRLESITIPDSVTSIGDSAFSGCTSMTSITIPDSVTSIGNSAFNVCTSLESMTLPFVGGSATENTFLGYIFGASSPDDNIDYVPESLKAVILTDSCTSIGDYAFIHCTRLESITIPDSVTRIGISAFDTCSSLTSITIPDSVTSIGDSAFSYCTSLESMTLPFIGGSATENTFLGYIFGASGFYGSINYVPESLKAVILSDICISIGDWAFYGCSNLTSVTIPDSVTSIGKSAFSNCTSLESITIPDSVTGIGDRAFYGCENLTIYGRANSYAEEYAYQNGYTFVTTAP